MKRTLLYLCSVLILLAAGWGHGGVQPAYADGDPEYHAFLPAVFNLFDPTVVTTGTIEGHVYSTANAPLQGAQVCSIPDFSPCVFTDENGYYGFGILEQGIYNLQVALTGYQTYQRTLIQVVAATTTTENFYLSPNILAAGDLRIEFNWTMEGDADGNLWLFTGTRIYPGPYPVDWGDCDVNACVERGDVYFGPEIFYMKSGNIGTHPVIVTKNQSLSDYEITEIGASVTIIKQDGTQIKFSPPIFGTGSWWYPFDLVWQGGDTQYNIVQRRLICTGTPPSTSSCTGY